MGSLVAHLGTSDSPDPGTVRRMAAAAPHRGDDVELRRAGRCALGVARMQETYVADTGAHGGLIAAFYGLLDNREELAALLRDSGAEPPEGEASLLAAAFDLLGDRLPRVLRGVYAVAISDGGHLWCFRDHLGFKPLLYHENSDGAFVATEAGQVLAGARIPREPDLEVVERIFYKSVDDERCALRGVVHLPPRTLLEARDRGVRLRPYWRPEELLETGSEDPEELAERFHDLLGRAVSRSLHGADVVALSGGVDSPAVAAYAAPLYRERYGEALAALTAVYPDSPSVDETSYVQAVARHLGLRLHTFESRARPTDEMRRWIELAQSPVPVVSLAEEMESLEVARRHGYRNVLTGEFAEYVFNMRHGLLPYLVRRGRWSAARRHLERLHELGVPVHRRVHLVAKAFLPSRFRRAYRGLKRRARMYAPAWIEPGRLRRLPDMSARRQWPDAQLRAFEGRSLSLPANDAIQAVAGVSVRRPFVDVDLWEFFLRLPAQVKQPDPRSKWLVKRWLRGKVPDVVLDRRDRTFFDEAIAARMDYDALRRWIPRRESSGGYRMPGVDYVALNRRLEARTLDLMEFMWAKDLAAVHAFLSTWEE